MAGLLTEPPWLGQETGHSERFPEELRRYVNVYDVDHDGLSDEDQWDYAAAQGRALLTFDKSGGRFIDLATEWFYAGIFSIIWG